MINAKELRIWNWAIYHGETDMPCQLDAQDIFNIATGYMENDKLHSPIPLTQEVLEKCGFEKNKDGDYECMNGVKLYQDEGKNFFNINSDFLTHFGSLHQLQNWYHANTGEELEYTS